MADNCLNLPTFSKYTIKESIITFFEDLELFVASKVLGAQQRLNLLEAVLRGPARAATISQSTEMSKDGPEICKRPIYELEGSIDCFYTTPQMLSKKSKTKSMKNWKRIPDVLHKDSHLIPLARYVDGVRDQVASDPLQLTAES